MDDFARFISVANNRSISRAAEQLRVSQPALSRTIVLLEERFQTKLFERTGAGVKLTDSGILLYEYASRAIRSIADAEEEIRHKEQYKKINLSIAAGDSWGYGILPSIIKKYSAEQSEVNIRVDIIDHESRMEGLKNGVYELAFGVVSPKFEDIPSHMFIPLVRAKYDVYCHENHPLLHDVRDGHFDEERLSEFPWINHKFEYDFDASQAQQKSRKYVIRTNTMLNTIELMRDSPFLISTAKTFQDIFQRFSIVRLTEDKESRLFVSGPIYLSKNSLRPAAKKFLAAVIAQCKQQFGSADQP